MEAVLSTAYYDLALDRLCRTWRVEVDGHFWICDFQDGDEEASESARRAVLETAERFGALPR